MKEILYVVLNYFAEHEIAHLPQAIVADEAGPRQNPKYTNKIVCPTLDPVSSVGGLRLLPDYSFDNMPKDFGALVLVGGYGWQDPVTEKLVPIIKDAIGRGAVVAGICNAASWMASKGFLNNVKHTGNGLDQLMLWGKENYTNQAGYIQDQAVRDGNVITANGTGELEFVRLILHAIENDTPEMIERFYGFYNMGLTKLYTPAPRFKFNTVGLFTTDNARTVKFYKEVFGFQTGWDGESSNVEMSLGDMRIILFPRNDFEAMVSSKFNYPEGLNGTMELAMDVPTFADVDKEYKLALQHGAKSLLEPTTEPWGQRTCYIADPDGNLIEIGSFVNL